MKKSTRYLSMLLVLVTMLGIIPTFLFSVAAEEPVNLATNAKITMGSNGYQTTLLNNGKTDGYEDLGYWTNDNTSNPAYGLSGTCYVEIDLGDVYDVQTIKVVNLVDTGRIYNWDAYGTTDNTADVTTWTKLGGKTVNNRSMECGYGINCEGSVRYIRIYGTYHSGNIGYHISEIEVYEEKLDVANRDQIAVGKWNDGWENWAGGSYGNATQLLLRLYDTVVYDENDNSTTITLASVMDGIDKGDLKTRLNINGFEMDINPSTYSLGYSIVRFEVCLDDTPFIPAKGFNYPVTLSVVDAKTNEVLYSGSVTTYCGIDPVYVYDDLYVPHYEELNYYTPGNADGHEVKDNAPILLPNHMPKYLASTTAGYEWEVVVNGSAIYRDIPVFNNYAWGNTFMGGVQFTKGGWYPKAETGYDVTFNVYDASYPSGDRVLVASMPMKDQISLTKTDVTAYLTSNYEISAENGFVYVDYDIETGTYTLTATPDKDLLGSTLGSFVGWYVNDELVDAESTTYTFTKTDGVTMKIVAKYDVPEVTLDEGLKFEGHQIGENNDIRFIGSVDSLEYETVDLHITVDEIPGKKFSSSTTKVYKTFKGTVNGVSKPVVTTANSGVTGDGIVVVDAEYLFGYAITGIPQETYTLNITPVAKDAAGNTYVGKTAVIVWWNDLAGSKDVEFTELNGVVAGDEYKYNDGHTSIPAGGSEYDYYAQLKLVADSESSITVDLAKKCALFNVTVYTYNSEYPFELYGSNDNADWTKLGASTDVSFTDGAYSIDVSGGYRYVKIVANGGLYEMFTVFEIDIFGTAMA